MVTKYKCKKTGEWPRLTERASAEQTRLCRQPPASRPALPLGLFPSGSANRYCYSFQAPRQPVWLRGLKLSPTPLAGNEITSPVADRCGRTTSLYCAPSYRFCLRWRGASWGSGTYNPFSDNSACADGEPLVRKTSVLYRSCSARRAGRSEVRLARSRSDRAV
jgi:hypothetical protein